MRAVCNGVVIAESNDTVVVEGHHYFPVESVLAEYLADSCTRTLCPWKGVARYKTVTVNDMSVREGAWCYPRPSPFARRVRGRVAFWEGVVVETCPRPADMSMPPCDG